MCPISGTKQMKIIIGKSFWGRMIQQHISVYYSAPAEGKMNNGKSRRQSTLRILFFCFLLKRIFYIFNPGRHRFYDMNVSINCAFLMCDHKTNDEM